jgi:2',3'-cyclic-nucleotide 2'-phosphodiesterase (5'-nucleotidase family)
MNHSKFFYVIFPIILNLGLTLQLNSETVTLVHSNDVHGIFKPYKITIEGKERQIGGMEAANHYINRLKENEKNMLLIDVGDIMTGTLAADIEYKGARGGAMIECFNALGYDVASFGSHIFDRGQENALRIMELSDFPIVMANIVYSQNGKLFAREPYHIFEFNGLRVGFIAVMEENFKEEVHRDRIKGIDVLPIIPTLNSYVPLIDKKTDLIVVLVHASSREGIRIAEEVKGIDVILTASEDGIFKEVNGVLIKSTLGHQKTLGYLKVEVEDDRIVNYDQKMIWLWSDIKLNSSPKISSLLKNVETLIGKEYKKIVGEAKTEMIIRYYPVGPGRAESPLGNWITDVMRWKTGAQVGLHNSGAIRANIHIGPISVEHIFNVSPFGNTLIMLKLNVKQLKNVLEVDINRGKDRLQVSGLKYRNHLERELISWKSRRK